MSYLDRCHNSTFAADFLRRDKPQGLLICAREFSVGFVSQLAHATRVVSLIWLTFDALPDRYCIRLFTPTLWEENQDSRHCTLFTLLLSFTCSVTASPHYARLPGDISQRAANAHIHHSNRILSLDPGHHTSLTPASKQHSKTAQFHSQAHGPLPST